MPLRRRQRQRGVLQAQNEGLHFDLGTGRLGMSLVKPGQAQHSLSGTVYQLDKFPL